MPERILLVSFAGHALAYGSIPRPEFANFFKTEFPHVDAQFYVDEQCRCYHGGLKGLTRDVPETVEHLRERFAGYDRVICVGASGGGYAALLFGSLLDVDSVIAFQPPTLLRSQDKDPRYVDVKPLLNGATRYHVFGDLDVSDPTDPHHVSHCERLADSPNVVVYKKHHFTMKSMRDSGELRRIFDCVIHKKDIYYSI
jgi:pimeloyl-ACP methyl ester carboxylesterase